MQHKLNPGTESISATALAGVSPCELKVVLKQGYRTPAGKSVSAQRGDREHVRFDARARFASEQHT